MNKPEALALIFLLVCLVGCGGGNSGNSSNSPLPPQAPQMAAGNWNLTLTRDGASPKTQMGGYLSSSSGAITGTVQQNAYGPCGFPVQTPVPISGTLNSNGQVSLTTSASSGLSAGLFTASLNAANGGTTMTGTFAYNCGVVVEGSVSGSLVPNISGSWSGGFQTAPPITNFNVSGDITESQTANVYGYYPLSGTLTFSGANCNITSGTILTSSYEFGGLLMMEIQTNNGLMNAIGTLNDMSTGRSMSIMYSVAGAFSCPNNLGTGTLTRQ